MPPVSAYSTHRMSSALIGNEGEQGWKWVGSGKATASKTMAVPRSLVKTSWNHSIKTMMMMMMMMEELKALKNILEPMMFAFPDYSEPTI